MMEFLVETELNEVQKEYVDTVKKSTEQLTYLINDILDFSKIEANKTTFEEVDFSVIKVVEDVIELLGEQANAKCISLFLTTYVKHDLVLGDPGTSSLLPNGVGRLRQILMNLVGNAIKFTDKGYVELEVASLEETAVDYNWQ